MGAGRDRPLHTGPQSKRSCLILLVLTCSALIYLSERWYQITRLPFTFLHETAASNTSLTFLSSIEEDAPSVFLDLPLSVKEIVINVGSNLDPIMPSFTMGPCAHSIAIEPIVGCQIMNHRQLSVINAAVSDKPGVASMIKNNFDGQSSSLAKVTQEDFWNNDKTREDGKRVIVPVITLSSILNAIPSRVKVSFIKTDMQGFDFVAIKAAGQALRDRVTHILNEVWFDDVYSYEAENDLCRDWLPFMTGLGYVLKKIDVQLGHFDGISGEIADTNMIKAMCEKQLNEHPVRPKVEENPGLVEGNVYWVRNDTTDVEFPDCETLYSFNQSYFSAEDYVTCDE
jgi:FkbM family methyltransferase